MTFEVTLDTPIHPLTTPVVTKFDFSMPGYTLIKLIQYFSEIQRLLVSFIYTCHIYNVPVKLEFLEGDIKWPTIRLIRFTPNWTWKIRSCDELNDHTKYFLDHYPSMAQKLFTFYTFISLKPPRWWFMEAFMHTEVRKISFKIVKLKLNFKF